MNAVNLSSPAVHSVFSWFLLLAQSPAYFPEISFNFFFLKISLFCIGLVFSSYFFSGWEMIRLSEVSVACYLMALVLTNNLCI